VGAFFPSTYHGFFNIPGSLKLMNSWGTYNTFQELTCDLSGFVLLASGSMDFLRSNSVRFALCALMVFGIDFQFEHYSRRGMRRLYSNWTLHRQAEGFQVSPVTHSDFGGVTTACHLVVHRDVEESAFGITTATPRTLRHVLNSASRGAFPEASPPPSLGSKHSGRQTLRFGDSYRIKGLLDVHDDEAAVICPCVFKRSGWTKRALTPTEFLRAYDSPLHLDQFLEPLPWK